MRELETVGSLKSAPAHYLLKINIIKPFAMLDFVLLHADAHS